MIPRPFRHTRRRVGRRTTGKYYVSLNLVHPGRVNRGCYSQVGHARTYDDFLDDRTGNCGINHWRSGYTHVFPASQRTLPSCGPDLFHSRRHPGPFYLLQTEDSFPTGLGFTVAAARSRTPSDYLYAKAAGLIGRWTMDVHRWALKLCFFFVLPSTPRPFALAPCSKLPSLQLLTV